MTQGATLDTSWYLDVNHFAVDTPWAHGFMKFSAIYAVGFFAVLVLIAWWYARYRPNTTRTVAATIWTAIATFVAVGINQLIAHAVGRLRPFDTLHHVEVLVPRANDFSFPSDHAITAGAVTAGLWIAATLGSRALRRIAVIATILALFIAFARVYVGAHYPGDVAAGLAIGGAITTIGWFALSPFLAYLLNQLARVRFMQPLIAAESGSATPPRKARSTTAIK